MAKSVGCSEGDSKNRVEASDAAPSQPSRSSNACAEPLRETEVTEVQCVRMSSELHSAEHDAPILVPTPNSRARYSLASASVDSSVSSMSASMSYARVQVKRLIRFRHGYGFDYAISLIIVASSLCVGLEIQCDLEGNVICSDSLHNLEHFFLVVFILELLVRVFAEGLRILKNGWFRFDAIVTATGVISSWVIEPIVLNTLDGDGSEQLLGILSQVVILRILRVLRLVRALRFFEQFHEMWKLANGIMRSFRTVLSALFLMVLTVYVFACIGIELLTKNAVLMQDPATAALIQFHFPSLQVAMLTLVQFSNSDSIASVYLPLVRKSPYLLLYFGLVWLTVTITLMNLITAVIVDTAISQGDDDRELEKVMKRRRLKALGPCIKGIFQELDQKGQKKGELSLHEFRVGLEGMTNASKARLPTDIRNILESDELIELYEHLDADGSGAIDEHEFIDGIFSLVLQSVPIETTKILQLLRSHSDMLQKIQQTMTGRRQHPRFNKIPGGMHDADAL